MIFNITDQSSVRETCKEDIMRISAVTGKKSSATKSKTFLCQTKNLKKLKNLTNLLNSSEDSYDHIENL